MTTKNFVVKNGIEVNDNLIFADPDSNRVGIGTSTPSATLDVNGNLRANNLTLSQDLSLLGNLEINGEYGAEGEYLVATGTGITWRPTPGLRNLASFIADPDQFIFNVLYTPSNGVDVFVNGARLSTNDYIANDGTTVELNISCFGGEKVDIVSYSVFGGSTPGITIQDNSVTLGYPNTINNINFVGFTSITLAESGVGVTVFNSLGDSIDVNVKNELRFYEDAPSCADYISFSAPGSLSTTTNYILPANYPASNGYVLSSNTSGTLSWVAGGGGGGGSGIVSCGFGITTESSFEVVLGPGNTPSSFKVLIEALNVTTKDIEFYECYVVNTIGISSDLVSNLVIGFNVQAPNSQTFLTQASTNFDVSDNLLLSLLNITEDNLDIKVNVTPIVC